MWTSEWKKGLGKGHCKWEIWIEKIDQGYVFQCERQKRQDKLTQE
jgi:hypothetical protein